MKITKISLKDFCRKLYPKPMIDEVKLGIINIKTAKAKIDKFYTAFEMSILSLGLV